MSRWSVREGATSAREIGSRSELVRTWVRLAAGTVVGSRHGRAVLGSEEPDRAVAESGALRYCSGVGRPAFSPDGNSGLCRVIDPPYPGPKRQGFTRDQHIGRCRRGELLDLADIRELRDDPGIGGRLVDHVREGPL